MDVGVQEIRVEQVKDCSLQKMWEEAEGGKGELVIPDELQWRVTEDQLGEVVRQLFIPKRLCSVVLSMAHRPGHLGGDRTTQRVRNEFYRLGFFMNVSHLCMSCQECQQTAPLRPLHSLGCCSSG